jgi:hypothetical protein
MKMDSEESMGDWRASLEGPEVPPRWSGWTRRCVGRWRGMGGRHEDGIEGVDGRLARELGGARGTTALVRLDTALRGRNIRPFDPTCDAG